MLVAHHETLALERVEVAGDGGLLLARAFRQLLLREFARAVQLVDEVPLARRDLVGLERGFQRLGDARCASYTRNPMRLLCWLIMLDLLLACRAKVGRGVRAVRTLRWPR